MRGGAQDMGWVVLILISIALLITGSERFIKWYKLRRQKKKLLHDNADVHFS